MKRRAAQAAIVLAVSAAAVFTGETSVNAAGSTYIDVSNSSPKAGEVITVKVRASESDTLTVTYDNTLLDPQQINAAGYSKAGNKITFNGISGTITFRAIDQGAAGLKVTAADPSIAACSMFVRVSSKSQENQRQQEQQTRQAEPDLNYNGKDYTISEKFQGQTLPFGFSQTRQTINNYNYKVLTNSTLQMTLVYLKESDKLNEDGHFFIYRQDGKVEPFYQLGDANQYLVLTAAEQVSGLTSSTLTLNGTTYPTYTDASGNMYAYGQDQTGNASWFRLDPGNGSFTAVADINSALTPDSQEPAKTEETSAAKDSLSDRIRALPLAAKIAGPIVLLLLLLASLMTVLRHRKKTNAKVPDESANEESKEGDEEEKSPLEQDTIVFEPTEQEDQMVSGEAEAEPSYASEEEPAGAGADNQEEAEQDINSGETQSDTEPDRDLSDQAKPDSDSSIEEQTDAQASADKEAGDQAEESRENAESAAEQKEDHLQDAALFAKVEQGRKDRLAKVSARFGRDAAAEEEEDAAGESAAQTKELPDIGDTTNLDPGSISVAAENKGSNDGVLEAVEAAVAYARRKAEQQAREDAANREEQQENLPELQVMDLNDL